MSKNLHLALVVAACSAASPVLAGDAPLSRLHVNPGLWEIVLTPQVSGEMPVPQSVFDKLPPERRAAFKAAMQTIIARQNEPHEYKECMTSEQLAKGFQIGKAEPSCKRTIVSNAATVMEVREECSSNGGMRTGHYRFEATDSGNIMGVVKMQITRGGKSMTVNNTIKGHWLSADCGDVKTIQLEH